MLPPWPQLGVNSAIFSHTQRSDFCLDSILFFDLSLSLAIYVYIYIWNNLYNLMSPSYPHYVPNAIKSPWFNLLISIHASMILESLEGQQLRPAKPKTLAILLVSQHFTPSTSVDIHQMRRRFWGFSSLQTVLDAWKPPVFFSQKGPFSCRSHLREIQNTV